MSVVKLRDLYARLEKYYIECNRTPVELKALYPPDVYALYSTSITPVYNVVIVHNFYASRRWFTKEEVKKKTFVAVVFLFDAKYYTDEITHARVHGLYNDDRRKTLSRYAIMARMAGFDGELEKRYKLLGLNVWNSLMENSVRRRKQYAKFKQFIAQVESVNLHE